jgi:hypothetical protein
MNVKRGLVCTEAGGGRRERPDYSHLFCCVWIKPGGFLQRCTETQQAKELICA